MGDSIEIHDDDLESVFLIWLDGSSNTSDGNRATQKRFQALTHQFQTFVTVDECQRFIQSKTSDHRIYLITSGIFGQEIVPQIDVYRQLFAVYVYCRDKQKNDLWAKHFNKVHGVFIKLDLLIAQIQSDLLKRLQYKVDEPFSVHWTSSNHLSIGNVDQMSFICTQLIFDSLLRMKTLPLDKVDLIDLCKVRYENDRNEMTMIEDFQRNYSSNQSIWWYTHDSCFSRLLNHALNLKNLDLLHLFGFFIRDIREVLRKNQCKASIQVYYGQMMSMDELNQLKNSVNSYLIVNRYFLTHLIRQQTISMLNNFSTNDEFVRVLFEIDGNPQTDPQRPFANISSFTHSAEEQQVLFQCGSIFQLTNVRYEKKLSLWVGKLIFSNLQKDFEENNFLSIGHQFLNPMKKFDLAEKYFLRVIKEIDTTDEQMPHCCHALGYLYFHQSDLQSSIDWYEKALEYSPMAKTYFALGCTHQKACTYHRALECYEKALNLWENNATLDDQEDLSNCWGNMGCIYENEQFFSKALKCHETSKSIREKFQLDLSSTYNNIGNIFLALGEFRAALEHYSFSLETKKKIFPYRHLSIATTLANIGRVYEHDGDNHQAAEYYGKASSILRDLFPLTHQHNVEIDEDLQRVRAHIQLLSVTTDTESAV